MTLLTLIVVIPIAYLLWFAFTSSRKTENAIEKLKQTHQWDEQFSCVPTGKLLVDTKNKTFTLANFSFPTGIADIRYQYIESNLTISVEQIKSASLGVSSNDKDYVFRVYLREKNGVDGSDDILIYVDRPDKEKLYRALSPFI